MASDDDDIPETGAIFTFGKTRFAENLANKFWIRDDKVLQLACGDEHSAVITNSGRLYTFGSNDWGQLGHGNNRSYTKPSVVKKLKGDKVKVVACGRSHTLVITESGVFSFGAGADSQLGHGDNKNYNIPTQIESLEDKNVTKVACGAEHSAVITDRGELYIWGSGSEGQLGLGTSECELPTLLKFRSKIVFVACGYYHTAVITDDGKLFTFGDNDGGKLGLEEHQCYNTEEPQQVKTINEHVLSVACGGSHTAAITKHGRLYTFGYGMHGQLGLGPSSQDVPLPKLISTLQRKSVTAVSCGESHSAVLTKSGELYTCGDGRHGKLGMGDESFSNLFKPERVIRFKEFHVDHVACGGCHMLAVAARNIEGVEESEESDDDLVRSAVVPSESAEDVVDGPQTSPRLSATVPLSGLSARDKRRKKDLENTTLSSSLPPLNRSSLPPLASLGITNTKKELTNAKPASNGGFNPLDRSMLPTISLKGPSPDERDDSNGKETLSHTLSSRRLPPRPKRRRNKPEPASDSEEEEEEETKHELEKTIRPKPLPRKQKITTQNNENNEESGKSFKKVQGKSVGAKNETASDASDEDSEEEEEEDYDRTRGTAKAQPSSSQSLAGAKKSEKIQTNNDEVDKHAKEDENSEEDEEEEEEEEEVEDNEQDLEEEEESGEDEEEEEEDESVDENEKPTKSKGSIKEGETEVTEVQEIDSGKEEQEDKDKNEDKVQDKKKKEKGKKNKDKDSTEDGKEEGKTKKKNKTEEDEQDKGKGEKSKTKSKDKKKTNDKNNGESEEEESEDKTEETEEGKDDGKEDVSEINDKKGEEEETNDNEKEEGDSKKDDKGKGEKSKKSGICLLL